MLDIKCDISLGSLHKKFHVCYSNKIKASSVVSESMFSPFRRLMDIFRERGATAPEKALSLKELGIPEAFGRMRPPVPPDIDPIIRIGNKYYLSEERSAKFTNHAGFPSPVRKWIQHTAKVPKGFLRYRVLHRLKEQPMSGAELTSALEDETDGRWRPKPGSIYPLLKSLLQDGLTRELSDTDGRTRRYELTDKGLQFLEDEIDSSGELREKIEQGFSPFPGPFSRIFERLDKMPPSILNLFDTLQILSLVIMSDPSPEVLEELSKAAERFSAAVEKIRKNVESREQVD
jgi:DNA-binding PadR family transcriptional regulator